MFLPPATKLGQGYIFTGVCDSVHKGGGVLSQHALQVVSQHALQQGGGIPACIAGGIPACLATGGCAIPACLAAGGCLLPGGVCSWGVCSWWGCLVETPQTATATGGMHPTGMHSCLHLCVILFTGKRGSASRGIGQIPLLDTTGYGQRAGGTHPTGMYSCLNCCSKLRLSMKF